MPVITYRTLQWSDFAVCKQLFYDTFDMEEDKFFFRAWKNRHKEASFVAVYHTVIIGFALVDTDNCIQYLAVNSQFRGQNVGSELMNYVCSALSDAPSIWLKTANDPRLAPWYAKFGFQEEHVYRNAQKEYLGTCMIRRQRGRRSFDTFSLSSIQTDSASVSLKSSLSVYSE